MAKVERYTYTRTCVDRCGCSQSLAITFVLDKNEDLAEAVCTAQVDAYEALGEYDPDGEAVEEVEQA